MSVNPLFSRQSYREPPLFVGEHAELTELLRQAAASDTEDEQLRQCCKAALESDMTWDKVARVGLVLYTQREGRDFEADFHENPQVLAMLTDPPEEFVGMWNAIALSKQQSEQPSLIQSIIQRISCCCPW